nr:MAG TPA: hypothetical protein [Caudoviricetes sp.]
MKIVITSLLPIIFPIIPKKILTNHSYGIILSL